MADLLSIIEPVVQSGIETRKIDLKREFDLSDKPRAAKFAKTITALANTPGGTAYIVVGVKDRKERSVPNDPLDYVVGFDPDAADGFQRQLQQALENFCEPIPQVDLRLLTHLATNRTIAVVQIARSFNRPHRLKKPSGEVDAGVYLKRGSDIFSATLDEIVAMQEASAESRLILNFARLLTPVQLRQLRDRLGALPEAIDMPNAPVQFANDQSLSQSAQQILDNVGLTLEEWGSLLFVVNLPGLAPAAAALLAEIHGRSGRFPHIIRLSPRPDDNAVYEVTEVVKLQNIRDAARVRSTR